MTLILRHDEIDLRHDPILSLRRRRFQVIITMTYIYRLDDVDSTSSSRQRREVSPLTRGQMAEAMEYLLGAALVCDLSF